MPTRSHEEGPIVSDESDVLGRPDDRRPSCGADWGAVLFGLAFPTVLTWVYFIALADSVAGLQQSAYSAGKLIQFAFPLVWVAAVRREQIRLKGAGCPGVVEGIAFGIAVLLAMLLAYHAWLAPAGVFQTAAESVGQKLHGIGLNGPWRYLALGVFYSLVHSLLEEYYWRWFVFGRLRRLVPLGPAVVVSSLGFAAHHAILLDRYFGRLSATMLLLLAGVAVGGAYWAWLYHRSRSLYGPWLSHLLIDAGIFLIGYDMLIRASSP